MQLKKYLICFLIILIVFFNSISETFAKDFSNDPTPKNIASNTPPSGDNPNSNDPVSSTTYNNPDLTGSNSNNPSIDPTIDPNTNKPRENNFFVRTDLMEEIFLNLSYEKLFTYPIASVLYGDKLYLPAMEFLNDLKINFEVKNSGKLIEGIFITTNQNYSVDFQLKTAQIGEKYIRLNDNDFVTLNGIYYVHPAIFENMFSATIDVDFNNLNVIVRSRDKLPALIFHEREMGRTELKVNEEQDKVALIYNKERTYLNAGFLDYSFSANFMQHSIPIYNYSMDLGTEFLGGDLKTSVNGNIENMKFKNMTSNFSWKYAFNENPYISQIYVGELNYRGQYNGRVNGVQITNTPVTPRVTFDKYTITEKTFPNSDVELYINNQLYDFKKADALGNVFFEIPLNFGSNNIFLKIFSPTGEVIENEKKIQVPTGFLPQGAFDYNISYGEALDTKDKLFSADVSAGLTNWLTNSTGVEKVISSGSYNPTFFNTVSARLFSQYLLNVTVAPEVFSKAIINTSFPSNVYFEAAHAMFNDNKFYNKSQLSSQSSVKGILPFRIAENDFITLFHIQNVKYNNNNTELKAELEQSFILPDFRASLSFKHNRSNRNSGEEISGNQRELGITNKLFLGTNYMLPDFGFLEKNLLNTNIHYSITDKKFQSLQTIFTTNVSKNFKVQLKYQTDFTPGTNDISAQFIFELPFVRNFTTVSRNSFSNSVQGSIGMDLNYRKFLLYNRNQVGSSAVSFRMFYDINNNGKYDSDEEILKHGKLNFRESATLDNSDENVLRVTELVPNQEYVAEVNESFLTNPLLIPKYKRFSFIASANIYKSIDIPFNMSQEVNGSITVKSGDQELKFGGIDVIIKNLETNEVTTLSSYFDGTIYALQFMPGSYEAYVKPQLLKNLNAVSYPEKINFTIENNNEHGANNELNFLLEIQK